MAYQIAKITKVTVGGRRSLRRDRPVLSCEIEFKVGSILCKKDITDTLSLRFNNYLPIEFIEQELPTLLNGRSCFVREGQGIQPYTLTGEIYDFVTAEIKRKWREVGMKKWSKKKKQACV